MIFSRQRYEILVPIFLFLLIFTLKYPVLNLPYSWDSMNYVIPAANHVYENGFTFFLWEYSNGHPPFLYNLLGFAFILFGNAPFVANFTIVLFSFLAVYFTYLLGKHLFNKKIGIISALLMFFYPTFFSYSGLAYAAVPLAALLVMSTYFFLKRKILLYVLFSSLLVLTEERAVVIPVALFFYEILKNRHIKFEKDIPLFIPVLVFFLWLVLDKIHYGYFFYPINASLFNIKIVPLFFNVILILKNFFFDYYKWILTSFIIISCFSFKLLKNRKLIYPILISLMFFLIILNINIFLPESLYLNYPDIGDYIKTLKYFSPLFGFLLFLFLVSFDNLIKFWNNKKFYLFYIISIFALFSYFIFVPFPLRYGISIYPILFLFFSVAMVKLFKKYSYIVSILILIIFVIQWSGDNNKVGFVLENNMEYVGMIRTHQLASQYLEENLQNSVILASYPQSLELKYPYLGYVNKEMNLISIPPYPGLTTKNSTIYNNPSKYNKTIDLNSIDILYYSEQEFKTKYSREIYNILNKTLIKEFESNGKSVEIYKIDKSNYYPNYVLPLD